MAIRQEKSGNQEGQKTNKLVIVFGPVGSCDYVLSNLITDTVFLALLGVKSGKRNGLFDGADF